MHRLLSLSFRLASLLAGELASSRGRVHARPRPLRRVVIATNNMLTGFPNLPTGIEQVWLGTNRIASSPDMSGFTGLTHLMLGDNLLTEVPDLSNNLALTHLDLSGNFFTEADCPLLRALGERNLVSYVFNSQGDGSLLNCTTTPRSSATPAAARCCWMVASRDVIEARSPRSLAPWAGAFRGANFVLPRMGLA